jgi:membrane-associated HD superfamily phosphohydrolase
MTIPFSRKLLMPALLAIAIAPLSPSAIADQHGEGHKAPGGHQSHHQQMRQALYERAGIDEATREALKQAYEEHHQALEDLHREHRERMDELLDDEQREALEAARREMRDEWREQRHAAMQERFESIVDGWNLSEEDREALRKTREALYADMQALREQDFETREERREAWQTVRNSHYDALSELLTDEQIDELKQAARPHSDNWHGHEGDGKQGKRGKQHAQDQGNDDTNGDTD